MSSSDFDWRSDEDKACVVVHHQPAIAVYVNSRDAVVMRQEGHYGPDEDQCIYVIKDNVPRVVRALLEAAGFETATTYGEPLPKPGGKATKPKPKDRTGAERQRRHRTKMAQRDSGRDDRDMGRDGAGDAELHGSDELGRAS